MNIPDIGIDWSNYHDQAYYDHLYPPDPEENPEGSEENPEGSDDQEDDGCE